MKKNKKIMLELEHCQSKCKNYELLRQKSGEKVRDFLMFILSDSFI